MNGQADVTVTDLRCEVRYNVTARGRLSTTEELEAFGLINSTTIRCSGKHVLYVFKLLNISCRDQSCTNLTCSHI